MTYFIGETFGALKRELTSLFVFFLKSSSNPATHKEALLIKYEKNYLCNVLLSSSVEPQRVPFPSPVLRVRMFSLFVSAFSGCSVILPRLKKSKLVCLNWALCVRACMYLLVCVFVRACIRVCVRAFVCVCVCVRLCPVMLTWLSGCPLPHVLCCQGSGDKLLHSS